MGMFDTVHVQCPNCRKNLEFQSKAGRCSLTDYSLQTAPVEILGDIAGDQETCDCGEVCKIVVSMHAWVETGRNPNRVGRILGRDDDVDDY